MTGEHPIHSLMKTALLSLQEMTKVNTIIGDPIETPDGHIILTVSRLGFGFAAGGSEFQAHSHSTQSQADHNQENESGEEEEEGNLPFGGGSGGGVSITPIAFLIVGPNGIQTLHLDNKTHFYEKLIDLAPQTLEKIEQWMTKEPRNSESEEHDQEQHKGTKEKKRGVIRSSVYKSKNSREEKE